ncbi:hypothetical protein DPMN_118531 [Dreissena polymorpha]|uniref:Uncharacterized protein n=1 Tax=Dreissena polymorpha TaxID=45954 RepID=A0A9D4GKX0_DREPO|nr:hypothetical protein DPMN_118531 [Dreissena polymorpha]
MSEKYSLNGREYLIENYWAVKRTHEDKMRTILDDNVSSVSFTGCDSSVSFSG